MDTEIPEKDKEFLRLLPILVNWIKRGKNLSDKEIIGFIAVFPKHYDFKPKTELDSMFKMATKYKDHEAFRSGIEILLSPEGREWVEDFFARLKKIPIKK